MVNNIKVCKRIEVIYVFDIHIKESKVIEVREQLIRVELPNGLIGYIISDELAQAGYEYADYMNSMVEGQGIDVVVQKIFIARQTVRLGLRRNVS